jgi:adenylyl-sulfate kinase
MTVACGSPTRHERERLLGQRGCVVWMTGLSGSGKSTIARALQRWLQETNRVAVVLDGDQIRGGLSGDLGFTAEDRAENVRRAAEVAALLAGDGFIVIAALIAPARRDRQCARLAVERVVAGRFLEVHVHAHIAECERRDPKGLYRQAREGAIRQFTGVDAPYEEPLSPDLVLPTARLGVEECVRGLWLLLRERGLLGRP